jgi:diguanylate cyclase (GGDEF)-like protein
MGDPADLAVLSDAARLAALAETGLLDSAAEAAFDRLTRLVSKILHVPTALVSLVDDHRQFFKSAVGLGEPWSSRRETPLSHSFCKHAVAAAGPLVIEDARVHPLVRDNLAIRDLGVVAYAGVPLTLPAGQTVGVLCAIDGVPRVWSDDDLEILGDLADSVVAEVRLRLEQRALLRSQALLTEKAKALESTIVQLEDLQVRLESLALTDEMTGLYNRRGFLRLATPQLKLAERKQRPLMLFFADLDGLKKINDELGHEVGDDAITQASRLLARVFRQSDVLARLGGDEFAALALEIANEQPVVARLEAALAAFNDEDARPYQLSISIGAVSYDRAAHESLETLLARADAVMYAAKRARRG